MFEFADEFDIIENDELILKTQKNTAAMMK